MTIPTAESLRKTHRRLARREHRVGRIVRRMRVEGLSLHLSHEVDGDQWRLSDGARLKAKTALTIIANRDIVATGRGLFDDVLGQVYRVITRKEK